MENNTNKTPKYFCATTTLFVSYTLQAAGIPPINITLSSGAGTNIVKTSTAQTNVVEYKLQDAIGRPPSRTWLWTPSALSYVTRTQSLHQPDCSIYNQANSNPNSFTLPPNGVCYFAFKIDGTQFAAAQTTTAFYRPMFTNSSGVAYGPCQSEIVKIALVSPTPTPPPPPPPAPPTVLIAAGSYIDGSDLPDGIQRPLLAVWQSTNQTWKYPESINAPIYTPNNTYPFLRYGAFNGASCYGNVCIAAGQGEDSFKQRPLLAISQNSGTTWSYPESIAAIVFTPNLHPFDNLAFLFGASCYDNMCIASGQYRSGGVRRPLLAVSQDSGSNWIFPGSITEPVFTDEFINGVLSSASCSGSACIAVGKYVSTSGITRPLLALNQKPNTDWIYPEIITTPEFTPDNTYPFNNNGLFNSASCEGSTCIAVGDYIDNDGNTRPLLALSKNSGTDWTYPTSITESIFTPPNSYPYYTYASFNGASCNGSTCVAVGEYASSADDFHPLLAVSKDSGETWIFPDAITAPVFTPNNTYPYQNYGYFSSVSCNKSTCIAVGAYMATGEIDPMDGISRPLLAVSRDSGDTWIFPESITAPVVTPTFAWTNGFTSVSCNESICIAAGSYTDENSIQRPLLASSQDQGATWSFPAAISDPVFTPSNTNPFYDFGRFNAAASNNVSWLPNSLKFIKSQRKQ